MLFSTSVSMVSSGLIYCRPLIVVYFRTRRTCPKVLDGKRNVFQQWWIEVCGTLDLILVVMGKTVSANGWPHIHGFGHVRVTAMEPFVESAKSLDLSKMGETKVL